MHFKMLFLVCILGLYTHKTNSQYLVSRASVSLPFDVNKSLHTTVSAHSQLIGGTRNRRMYAMCPPSFQRVGADCYSLVEQRSSWLEAHFFCKDKNAKLAEPLKYADRKLRVFLAQHDMQTGDSDPIWIGATFDHHNNVWQYGISGRNLSYANFERLDHNRPMDNQCAVYDSNNKYRWSSRSCPDKFRFICEHKMPKVSERNRHKVYHRWNATYPNQYANEVVLKVIDNNGKNDRRNHRRVIADGSNEEIHIPKVRIQNARRRQHLLQRQNGLSNDVNYDGVAQKRQKHISTTMAPHDIQPSFSDNPKPQTDRQLTSYDRKLQRQREKEQRRQQRKRERQERMRAEKRNHIRQHRQHQLNQQRKQNKHEPALLQKELENRNEEHPPPLQKSESHHNHEPNAPETERQVEQLQKQPSEENSKRAEEERLQKQHEAEKQENEKRLLEQESKAREERLQKEREKHLKELEKEHERQLQAEKEYKLRQEEELRKQFEEQEKQRLEQIKRNQEEEDKLKELQRLEEAKLFEQHELDRLREENQKREEAQRKREEEIARREAEQRQIEYEEERIRKELEQAEIERNLKHEEEIKREEEALKAREESEKREREEKERLRQERFNVLKQQADQQVKKEMEEKRRYYAERISKLSPEDQKAFIEMRKRRRQLRVKQQTERLKRAHAEINAEALKESSTNGEKQY